MSDHGVHGVDGPVGGSSGGAGYQSPEHRGDDGVDRVFGQRLDYCGGDACLVEVVGVASD